jgi:ribonuclease Z
MGSTIIGSMLGMLLIVLAPLSIPAQSLKVTLLGTGDPAPRMERFGPSILVEAGGERFLFDCGRGASQRLFQLRIPLASVNALFLTHLHSDHVVGIPDLWLTGWVMGRVIPLRVWGPIGTKEMTAHLEQAYQADMRIRMADERLPAQGVALSTDEIVEGVVYDSNGVKVAAFEVDHGALIKPAFGYRIDYAGRSVVLSGDTRPSDTLIGMAQGVEVLIHEVAAAPPTFLQDAPRPPGAPPAPPPERLRSIIEHHTTPEQAGEIFGRVTPKLAVYSHITLVGGLTVEELSSRTRTMYTGPLEVGEDLMVIDVGETVTVQRAK